MLFFLIDCNLLNILSKITQYTEYIKMNFSNSLYVTCENIDLSSVIRISIPFSH